MKLVSRTILAAAVAGSLLLAACGGGGGGSSGGGGVVPTPAPTTAPPSGDSDLLHWIEGIFTSTPTDKAFQKPCRGDYGGGGPVDCRILIAGTSQATPHVAGAAALLLSVGVAPGSVKSLLCSNATHLSDPHSGCGRLNIYRAMAAAVGDSSLPSQSSDTLLCSTSGAPQSQIHAPASMPETSTQFELQRPVHHDVPSPSSSQRLLVLYDRVKAQSHSIALQSLQTQGLKLENEMDLARVGRVLRVVDVPSGTSVEAAMQQLRAQNGVLSVERDFKRYAQSTTAALVDDPYFKGDSAANTPPLYENSSNAGQWDVHVVCAANAWAYGASHPGAAGGTVPIAIIDTGADLTHGDLSGRATVTEIIDSGNGTVQSGMHDNDGHGTNVAGIAAATANNGFGFAGIAYKSPLQIYKVFPDPPAGCDTTNNQHACDTSASGADEIKAIQDAVAHGAKVINLSLGSGGQSPAEASAIQNAIASGVVVVAASGNGNSSNIGQPSLDCPACYSGVIAVGASALNDPTGGAITERVAGYSNYDSANPSGWGIVAPGGDPSQ